MLPIGPAGDTVAASSTQGNTRRRHPSATATQRRIQPTPWVQPSACSADSEAPESAVTTSAPKTQSSSAEKRRTAVKYDISSDDRVVPLVGLITGERTVEIDAPIDECFEIAADIEGAPKWQGSLKRVDVLESDAEGRPELVETDSDAKVKTVKSRLRFSYDKPHRIEWVQEKGEAKSVRGWWELEDLGGGRTRATYGLRADPGRVLGMLLRGPAEGKVRDFLLGGAAEGLKRQAEQG